MSTDLSSKALRLSWFTVLYNILEGILSITAGIMANSSALAGFGLDSMIESLSGGIMIWRFSPSRSRTGHDEEELESRAVKLVGVTFFIFGAYVLIESATSLYFRDKPETSLFGIVIATASVIVMPLLYTAKIRTGKALNSRALIADASETLACVFLSLSLLAGLLAHWLFGLWWIDPAIGIVIALLLFREGMEVFDEEDDD